MIETHEYLTQVFTPKVLQRLASISSPSEQLKYRLDVLTAHGPNPTNRAAAYRLQYLRAKKAAWEVYAHAALICGFFDSPGGRDLRERLTGGDDNGFRSAMTECMACWFFAGKHRFPVTPYPRGRLGKRLDMSVKFACGEARVEVKAPYKESPRGVGPWFGEHSDVLAQCLDTANKQFSDDTMNILVIAPELRLPVHNYRFQLIKAFFGQEKITVPIDPSTGGPAGPVGTKFFPDGKFLNRYRPKGKHLKINGQPAFTRVSAVLTIEEFFQDRYPYANWVDHHVLVLHNPFARHPLAVEVFEQYIRFIDLGEGFGWSDGCRLSGRTSTS